MKNGILIMLAISLTMCCNSDDRHSANNDRFDCLYEGYSTKDSNLNEGAIFISNVMSPELDSVNQFCISLSIYPIDLLSQMNTLRLEVFDLDGDKIYETSEHKLVDFECNTNAKTMHLWDLQVDSEDQIGEFEYYLRIDFEDNQYIQFENTNFISVSCEQINNCINENADDCNFDSCQWHSISLRQNCGGWGTFPDIFENCG